MENKNFQVTQHLMCTYGNKTYQKSSKWEERKWMSKFTSSGYNAHYLDAGHTYNFNSNCTKAISVTKTFVPL